MYPKKCDERPVMHSSWRATRSRSQAYLLLFVSRNLIWNHDGGGTLRLDSRTSDSFVFDILGFVGANTNSTMP